MSQSIQDVIECALFKQLIDGLPLAVFCKDYGSQDGKFLLWNRQATLLWGLEAEAVLGKTDFDLFPPEQAASFKATDLKILQDPSKVIFIQEECADSPVFGKVCVRTWKAVVTEDGKPRFLMGISQNLEELKKLEREIFEQGKKLARAEAVSRRTEVAREVAHQVNNPLTIFLGQVNRIKKLVESNSSVDEISQVLEQSARAVHDTAERIHLLTELLSSGGSDESMDLAAKSTHLKIAPASSDVFFHDIMNALTIAFGKSEQLEKILSTLPVTERDGALKKMISLVQSLEKIKSRMEEAPCLRGDCTHRVPLKT